MFGCRFSILSLRLFHNLILFPDESNFFSEATELEGDESNDSTLRTKQGVSVIALCSERRGFVTRVCHCLGSEAFLS